MHHTIRFRTFVLDIKTLTLVPPTPTRNTTESRFCVIYFPSCIHKNATELFEFYKKFFDVNKRQRSLISFPCAATHPADYLNKDWHTNQWPGCSIIRYEKLTILQVLKKTPTDPLCKQLWNVWEWVTILIPCALFLRSQFRSHRNNDYDRATICCVYKNLTDVPDSRIARYVHFTASGAADEY
jgi:hypothetical protein